MAISEKTRKVLWGRSGNRCGLCGRELVIDATAANDESVVGDECHIASAKPQGPRHDPAFACIQLDEPENLILLCRVHHKMVDDQCETYTVEMLQTLKKNHEKWVSSTLAGDKQVPPVRLRRIKENIPDHLIRLKTGQDLMKVIDGALASSFEHDEPRSEAEVELLGSFLQEVQDWGDLSSDLEPGERVRASFRMSTLLQAVEEAGFWVFGGREDQRLEGGVGVPSSFPVAIIRVLRATSPEIMHVDLRTDADGETESQDPNNAGPA